MLKRLLQALRPEPLLPLSLDAYLSKHLPGAGYDSYELTDKVRRTMRKLGLRNAKSEILHIADAESGSVVFTVKVSGEVGFFRRRAASGYLARAGDLVSDQSGTYKISIEYMPHAYWYCGYITWSSWRAQP